MKKVLMFTVLFTSFLGMAFAAQNYQYEAAKYLASQGIIASVQTEAEYRLNDTITRKETMKLVAKIAGGTVNDTDCQGVDEVYNDVVSNDWGCKYIGWAYSQGHIVGKIEGGKQILIPFRPNDNITKSEAVKLIFKAKGIQKAYNTENWQQDYAKTAVELGLADPYTDYNADATRGWIFRIAARGFEEYKVQEEVISDEAL